MSMSDALKWQLYTISAWQARDGAPPPVQGEIEVMAAVDPNAPVVEGVIVGEVPGDLPE